MTKKIDITEPKKPDDLPDSLDVLPPEPATKAGRTPVKKQSLPKVTPVELDNVQRHVLAAVKDNMPRVRSVLSGDLRWTNQQVKLFQIMLNKVMPDLKQTHNEHYHHGKEMHELSREELEAIVAEAARADKEENYENSDIIDVKPVSDEAAMAATEELSKDE
jgi:hypothetical protein